MARAAEEKGWGGSRSAPSEDGEGHLPPGDSGFTSEFFRSPYLTKALESSTLDISGSSSRLTMSENLLKAPSSGGGSLSVGLLAGLDSLERLSTSIFGLDGEADLLLEGGGETATSSLILLSLSNV